MCTETDNGAAAPAARGTDGLAGGLALGGTLVLTVCLLVSVVATTLQHMRSTPRWEGRLTDLICFPPDEIVAVGALAGGLTCLCLGVLAVRHLRRARAVWSGVFLLGAAASAVASHTLAWSAWRGSGVRGVPVGAHWRSRLAVAALGAVWAVWAARAWRRQQRRIAAGDFHDAEARIEACLRRVTPRELLASWPGLFLSASVFCLLVCVPTAWSALAGVSEPGGAYLISAVVLSASGAVLFCVLQCAALAVVLGVLVALVRLGRLSGTVSLVVGVLAGAFAFLFALWGTYLSLGDQIPGYGLTALAWVLLLVAGMLYGVAVSRHVLALCRDPRHPRDLRDLIRVFILAGVLFPILALVRRLRGRVRPSRPAVAAACVVIALILLYLRPALFPRALDFLNRIRFFLVALIILLTVLAGHLLWPFGRKYWRASLGALVVLVGASVLGVVTYDHAMTYARASVFRRDEIGKHSLRVIEGILPLTGREGGNPVAWVPPKLLAPPTRRRPIMEELKKKRPLTIIFILDACRPDRMSVYGYRRKTQPFLSTTPNLDRHKDDFLRFTTAFTPGSSTSCAMRKLLTGRFSSRWMLKTKGIAPFWTNELIRAGYHSFVLNIIGWDENGVSTEAFLRDMPPQMRARVATLDCAHCTRAGKTEGQPLDNPRASPQLLAKLKGRPAFLECNHQAEEGAVDHLLKFLADHRATRGQGVFAYIHGDVTHCPWRRLPGVEDFGAGDYNRFDESVRFSDIVLGDLIGGLKKLGMWDDTLLLVTADHGSLIDIGGFHPYHYRLRIPLLLKIPGVRGREIDSLVSLFDFGPTLMDVFYPDTLRRYEGRSLWPVILGQQKWPDRVLFCLSAFSDCYALVRANGWQYISHRGERYEQLYNWRKDPGNKNDLLARDRTATQQSRKLMEWFLYDYGKGRTYTNPYHYRGPP